jgi:hypothetical protein
MSFQDILRGYKNSKMTIDHQGSQSPPEYLPVLRSSIDLDEDPGEPGHLALLMIVIDEVPYEAVWRAWSGLSQVQVLVHAKHPERVSSPWVRERLVPSTLRPEWGSLELVEAALLLLREGLSHTRAGHFAFVSESCVPAMPCAAMLEKLAVSSRSWLKLVREATNGYVQSGQFAPLQSVLGKDKVAKASQWCVLARRDASAVLGLEGLLPLFRAVRVRCPDEMYFATALLNLGMEIKIEDQETTYTRWADPCDKSPQNLSLRELKEVVAAGKHFFCRKLKVKID